MRTINLVILILSFGSGCAYRSNPVPGPGALAFYWTFGSSAQNCAASGVVQLDVSVDGAAGTTVNCVGPNRVEGIQVNDFQPGPHSFDVRGYRANDQNIVYEGGGQVNAVGDQLVQIPVNLDQLLGDLTVNLAFQIGSSDPVGYDCTNARITQVSYELDNSSNTPVSSTLQTGSIACGSFTLTDLAVGNYSFRSLVGLAQGTDGAHHTYNQACGVPVVHGGDQVVTLTLPQSNGLACR